MTPACGPRLPAAGALGRLEEDGERLSSCSSLSDANEGIGEPGVTQLGHFRWSICNWTPRSFVPSSVSSGAPRFCEPAPW